MTKRETQSWEWDGEGAFSPVFDACASPQGISYGCEIKGPCCGYDSMGSQTWAEFLTVGPPAGVQMPAYVAAEIRAYGLARTGAE